MAAVSVPPTPRPVIVDDTDPTIHYTANQWLSGDGSKLTFGNLGPVWNGSIHRTIVDGATLTYNFNGSSIDVIGSINTTTLADGTLDPQWGCTVDQIPIANGTNEEFLFPENNWLLCNQDTLVPGPHTLTIKVQSKGTPFYFDRFMYTPLPGVEIDGAVVDYAFGDPAITYSSGWVFYTVENTQNITQTNGAQVTLNFHGTAVSLGGYIPQELPHTATTAKYSIDGGAATTFSLPGLAANSNTTLFNVPLFTVSGLKPADHTVVVTYLGDSNHTPLGVKDFFVTNSTTTPAVATPPSSSSSKSSATSSSSTTSIPAAKPTPTGAIAGGVVGALAVIALLAGLLFWLRRRRQHRDDTPHRPGHGEPPFAIDVAEAGSGGASFMTGRATYGTSTGAGAGPSSHAAHENPFDPYAESGSHAPARTPFSAPPPASATTPYPYPYTAVPHERTLSSESQSEASSSALRQASDTPPSSTSGVVGGGGGGGGGLRLATEGAAAAAAAMPLAPQRTKSQEARMGRGQQKRVVVQRHQDSGVRLHGSTPSLLPEEVVVEELPPDYSRD
ncbi:hypothetical protein K438DRAFT_2016262 [Mycena galopus ATCC 62051]|nr:hypothetical protein K438DRAFT_2016262 [Mycena galopus ATCC 62051]